MVPSFQDELRKVQARNGLSEKELELELEKLEELQRRLSSSERQVNFSQMKPRLAELTKH